ncbi:amidohydrolase family protein [Streptomyces griseorubiginosus]|uniref:amidohydrolase family protein n=1 Tax=Streptomyces TaxID=1883 RepID=UPI003334959A
MPRPEVWDCHVHLDPSIGGDPLDGPRWNGRPPSALFGLLDTVGVTGVTDLDGGWGEQILRERLDRFGRSDRYRCFGGVAWDKWAAEGNRFAERSAHRLRRQVARGARGLKISKALGLTVVDDRSELVPVDDPRLDPIWRAAGDLGVPVLIHTADPPQFFEPSPPTREAIPVLDSHPEWRVDPSAGLSRDVLFEQLCALVTRHRRTRFVAAHLGNVGDDLERLDAALSEHCNLGVDTSARFEWLGQSVDAARRLLIKHSDRVLFGSDYPLSERLYRTLFRLFESRDTFTLDGAYTMTGAAAAVDGLGLPEEVLERLYAGNHHRLLVHGP